MRRRIRRILKGNYLKHEKENPSSYDTTRDEINTPQKVREANEPEAVRQRLEKSK
jgi:hypothetical protein